MTSSSWYLESRVDTRGRLRRVAVRPLPFRVGRQVDSDLFLNSSHGSQRHAELFEENGELWVRDLDSTNGTSVNGRRLEGPLRLTDGDVIHFADCELLVIERPPDSAFQTTQVFSVPERERLEAQVQAPGDFRRMLSDRTMRTDFQPVVKLSDRATFGYEILGRGLLGDHQAAPEELFYIAEQLGEEVTLSEAFRARGLELAGSFDEAGSEPGLLFLNTHPAELADPTALLASLQELRRAYPKPELSLEIHEAAVTDLASLKALSEGLSEMRISIAFDDFGTGQARLLELAEIAPRYLKFDAAWVEDLHLASARRHDMVARLLRLVGDLGVTPIAECVESQEEADACRQLGFALAQGHYFGPPSPVEAFLSDQGSPN